MTNIQDFIVQEIKKNKCLFESIKEDGRAYLESFPDDKDIAIFHLSNSIENHFPYIHKIIAESIESCERYKLNKPDLNMYRNLINFMLSNVDYTEIATEIIDKLTKE